MVSGIVDPKAGSMAAGPASFTPAADAVGSGADGSSSGDAKAAADRASAPAVLAADLERDPASYGLLRHTAELANAAASLSEGLRAVQRYLARQLGWSAAGYRIFSGGGVGGEFAPPTHAEADHLAPGELTEVEVSTDRGLVFVPVREGSRIAAVLGFCLPYRQATPEDQALLAEVAAQLAALAQRDIYRQGMLTRELEILRQAQLAGMAELAQSLSHELSQPLAALTAYVGALRRLLDSGNSVGAEVAYLGERLLQQVERAGGILQGTKSFVLQRSSPTGSVDVEAVIRKLAGFARRELRTDSVELQLELAPGMPPARGSESHLAQIVLSLLANALSALRPVSDGGRRVIIRAAQVDREIHIGVVDSGRHLAPEAAGRDRPFYMAYADAAQIGLAISRSLAEIHGGRLWTERQGSETAIVVALPVIH